MEIKTKDGRVFSLEFAHYGEARELNETDGERIVFEFVKSLCPLAEFVRKSDAYLTAAVGETDICRFKWTDKTKWILFPYMSNNKKHYMTQIDDLSEFEEEIIKSYEIAQKYQ